MKGTTRRDAEKATKQFLVRHELVDNQTKLTKLHHDVNYQYLYLFYSKWLTISIDNHIRDRSLRIITFEKWKSIFSIE